MLHDLAAHRRVVFLIAATGATLFHSSDDHPAALKAILRVERTDEKIALQSIATRQAIGDAAIVRRAIARHTCGAPF